MENNSAENTNQAGKQANTVNKEAFQMLACEIGLNAACRKLGVPIPTGKSWARRGGWKLPKRLGGRPSRTLPASSESSLHPIADALVSTHKELDSRTRTALAQATTRAAEGAATAVEPLPVTSTSHLRDIASAAAQLFGWNQSGVTVNANQTLVVTPEQLEQIRQLRGATVYEAAQSETPTRPFPESSPYGPVDEVLKITS
jgi:hypothetical protein